MTQKEKRELKKKHVITILKKLCPDMAVRWETRFWGPNYENLWVVIESKDIIKVIDKALDKAFKVYEQQNN
jgi:hypothetical protein